MTYLLILDEVETICPIRVDVVLEGSGPELSVHHMTRLGRQVKKKAVNGTESTCELQNWQTHIPQITSYTRRQTIASCNFEP